MERKKGNYFNTIIRIVFLSCLVLSNVQGAKPLWTFVPESPTDITVAKGQSAQVIYTVYNQSRSPKRLVMKVIAGISQTAPCQLPGNGACTLILNVNGSTLQGDVVGGPILCQNDNDLQCYQPDPDNILRIRLIENPPVQQFTLIPSAGANGSISPTTVQVVNAGSSQTFTATPSVGFGVYQWLLDGNAVQNGGNTFVLNNIQANHSLEVTFGQTTLSPLSQSLTLSIKSPGASPALAGNARLIRIENTGSMPASNVQVNSTGLPFGTTISNNGCSGTVNAGATCDITITPGGTASSNNNANACNLSPGTEPVPAIVTVGADNALPININVLVLGYGCIYQGGFLFSVDDSTSPTGSIGGKVAALTDQNTTYKWSTVFNITGASSLTNGLDNTNALATPVGQYPAAQTCLNKSYLSYTDWYLPAICELGRYVGVGTNAGCGINNANLYTSLRLNNIGGLSSPNFYLSSSQSSSDPQFLVWAQDFSNGHMISLGKGFAHAVRCIRVFTP